MGRVMRWFHRAVLIAAIGGLGALGGQPPLRAAEVAIECVNPASGATWQIKVDYDKRTVNSYPAEVSNSEITWRDLKDRYKYALDRSTGKLTVVFASSTGGNFLVDHCKLGS